MIEILDESSIIKGHEKVIDTKVGVYLDISNLYYCVKNRYGKYARLRFETYLAFCQEFGKLQFSKAYGAQKNKEAENFIKMLQKLNIETHYQQVKEYKDASRKANWDVGIAVDILKDYDNLDTIIIGSADGDFESVVKTLLQKQKKVCIFAANVSSVYNNLGCEIREIPEVCVYVINEQNNRK